eukprot:1152902-Pelagomonas_calceolata.AAC.1
MTDIFVTMRYLKQPSPSSEVATAVCRNGEKGGCVDKVYRVIWPYNTDCKPGAAGFSSATGAAVGGGGFERIRQQIKGGVAGAVGGHCKRAEALCIGGGVVADACGALEARGDHPVRGEGGRGGKGLRIHTCRQNGTSKVRVRMPVGCTGAPNGCIIGCVCRVHALVLEFECMYT